MAAICVLCAGQRLLTQSNKVGQVLYLLQSDLSITHYMYLVYAKVKAMHRCLVVFADLSGAVICSVGQQHLTAILI